MRSVNSERPLGRPVGRLNAMLSLVFALMLLYMPYQFQRGEYRLFSDWVRPLGVLFLVAAALQGLLLAGLRLHRWLRLLGHLLYAAGLLALALVHYRALGPRGAVGYLILLLVHLLTLAMPGREPWLFRMMIGGLLLINGALVILTLRQPNPATYLQGWVALVFLVPGLLMLAGAWLMRRWPWTGWATVAPATLPVFWYLMASYQLHNWFVLATNLAMLGGIVSEWVYLYRPWRALAAGLRMEILALTLTVAVVPTIGLGAYSVYVVETGAQSWALEALATSLLFGTLAVALLAVTAGTLVSSRWMRRLATLRAAIAAIGQQSDLPGESLQPAPADEISLVADTLREMTAQLAATHAELETQNRRLNAILRVLPVGVYLADSEGKLYHVNEAGRRMWGLPQAPLVAPEEWGVYRGRDPVTGRLLAPEERAMYAAMHGEERLHEEMLAETLDGQRRTFLVSAVPVRDENGTITDIVGTTVDISRQKEAEEALRTSESLLAEKREILEAVAVGAPLKDVLKAIAHFTERRVSGGLCEIWLVEESGISLRLAAAPSLPHGLFHSAETVYFSPDLRVTGPAVTRKETVVCEDIAADPAWAEHREALLAHGLRSAWSVPILNARGESLGAVTIFYPVRTGPSEEEHSAVATATHLASMAIERDRVAQGHGQSLESLLQNMAEGVVAVNEHRRLVFINPQARRLLAVDVPASDDPPMGGLVPECLAIHLERMAGPGTYQPERVVLNCAGRNLEADISPVYSDLGRFGALAVIRDVTEQVKFRRLQESFVANVSHELRAPLTSISATLEAIADGVISDSARPRYLKAVLDEMARLRRLSFDVLDVTRLDSGAAEMKSEPVEVTRLLESVRDRVAQRAAEAGVQVRADGDWLFARGDSDRIDQVLTNLVDNAIRYTPSGGEIWLRSEADGDVVRISVTDTGIGIPKEHLTLIFERFYKVDSARTPRQGGGTGLGLAIARQLVERMGGRIWADSVEGKGTTLTFTLPLISRDEVA